MDDAPVVVRGQRHRSLAAYMRSTCDSNGDVSIKTLAHTLRFRGAGVQLEKMPRQFNDLSPNARVVALIRMGGAFVARRPLLKHYRFEAPVSDLL